MYKRIPYQIYNLQIFPHSVVFFYFLDNVLWCTKMFLILMKYSLSVLSSVVHVFGVLSKNLLPNSKWQKCTSVFPWLACLNTYVLGTWHIQSYLIPTTNLCNIIAPFWLIETPKLKILSYPQLCNQKNDRTEIWTNVSRFLTNTNFGVQEWDIIIYRIS